MKIPFIAAITSIFFVNLFASTDLTEPSTERVIKLNTISLIPQDVKGILEIRISTINHIIFHTCDLKLIKGKVNWTKININFTGLSGDAILTAKFTSTITAETRQLSFAINGLNGMTFMILPTKNLLPWNFIGIVPKDGAEDDIGIVPKDGAEDDIGIVPGYDAKCTKLIPTKLVRKPLSINFNPTYPQFF